MNNLLALLKGIKPNRIAVYLTAIASLLTAIAPMLADLDTSDVVGLVSGLAAIVTVVVKFLDGWQKHEARLADPYLAPFAQTDAPS